MSSAHTAKMAATLDLFEAGVALRAQRYRREHPEASEDDVRAFISAWLADRPGAPAGDAAGRAGSWPRHR